MFKILKMLFILPLCFGQVQNTKSKQTTTLIRPTTTLQTTLQTTLAPPTLAPPTLAPPTLAPSTLQPSTLPPPTLAPSTLQPSTLQPSTLPQSTLPPTITTTSTSINFNFCGIRYELIDCEKPCIKGLNSECPEFYKCYTLPTSICDNNIVNNSVKNTISIGLITLTIFMYTLFI